MVPTLRSIAMSLAETLYLILILAAFAAFSVNLAAVAVIERKQRRQ